MQLFCFDLWQCGIGGRKSGHLRTIRTKDIPHLKTYYISCESICKLTYPPQDMRILTHLTLYILTNYIF
jgi:hypothetical protein